MLENRSTRPFMLSHLKFCRLEDWLMGRKPKKGGAHELIDRWWLESDNLRSVSTFWVDRLTQKLSLSSRIIH